MDQIREEECLSKIVLFGERSLRWAVHECVAHYRRERNHQGKSNVLPFLADHGNTREGTMRCRERLGGPCAITIKEAA
jgi:putative transposase